MNTAAQIATALGGKRAQRLGDGGWLVPCPVPSHGKGRGDRSPSLRIGDGETRVLVHCYGGCDPRDVLDELRRRRLLDDRSARVPNHDNVRIRNKTRADDHERRQHDKARWLWSRRQPITGTIAETYLRARGIACALPSTLGFLPGNGQYHPAMIAAFGVPDEIEPGVLAAPRKVEAVHLTKLKDDGTGKAEMPDGKSSKIIVGRPVEERFDDDGNIIEVGLPIVLAPPNDLLGLAITEGIEDALSVHEATGLGTWAAGSAAQLPMLADVIPGYVETLTIFADDDKAGQDNARKLAAGLRGRSIEITLEGAL
ncbi:hypothetical protein AB7M17_003953 [Bradyrhizobium sp. USDA 377]